MIQKELFGKTNDGKDVYVYTFSSGKYEMRVMNFGATILSLLVPDKYGKSTDVVFGFDNISAYEVKSDYIGAVLGRFGNRIRRGQFELNGKKYQLPINNGKNALHGGIQGFDKKVWASQEFGDSVKFTYKSPDGEEGYPGNFTCQVTYSLSENGVVRLEYSAFTDADTIFNNTNHSYFNLSGSYSEKLIDDHIVCINSDFFTESDDECMPTGQILKVDGTELDLRESAILSNRFKNLGQYTNAFNGYDNTFILNKKGHGTFDFAASAWCPDTGIKMECWTTLPAMQFYTGNNISVPTIAKHGKAYKKHEGFCFETQNIPDSPNISHFSNTVIHPGEIITSKTEYRFSVK